MAIRVSECYVYPLKSARGISVDTLDITSRGPLNDRLWMLVQAQEGQSGKFISQRDKGCEKLSVVAAIPENDQTTRFILPDGSEISINKSELTDYNGEVTIWGDACKALDAGDEAAAFFSNYLGQPCRLVRAPDDFIRHTSPEYSQQGDNVGFADGFPLLVTNHASLRKLADHFPENTHINMQRFRPNIVLEGAEAFEEDVIHELKIGNVVLEFVKPCSRCKITTIDQSLGAAPSNEPLQTLAKTRRGKGGGLQGVFFGQNAIPRKLGQIKVGDEAEILSKRALHPALQNAVLRPNSK